MGKFKKITHGNKLLSDESFCVEGVENFAPKVFQLIDIQDVFKIYNKGENEVRALDGINLNIKIGEFVAIIGQSGSGKSTLMNILGCLDIPSHGEYILDGKKIGKLNDNELSLIRNLQIGFIFQGFNLISSLDAFENVELPLIYRGLKREERQKLAFEPIE